MRPQLQCRPTLASLEISNSPLPPAFRILCFFPFIASATRASCFPRCECTTAVLFLDTRSWLHSTIRLSHGEVSRYPSRSRYQYERDSSPSVAGRHAVHSLRYGTFRSQHAVGRVAACISMDCVFCLWFSQSVSAERHVPRLNRPYILILHCDYSKDNVPPHQARPRHVHEEGMLVTSPSPFERALAASSPRQAVPTPTSPLPTSRRAHLAPGRPSGKLAKIHVYGRERREVRAI
jgi:hypothetical protein